jgi:hypothetical protein
MYSRTRKRSEDFQGSGHNGALGAIISPYALSSECARAAWQTDGKHTMDALTRDVRLVLVLWYTRPVAAEEPLNWHY